MISEPNPEDEHQSFDAVFKYRSFERAPKAFAFGVFFCLSPADLFKPIAVGRALVGAGEFCGVLVLEYRTRPKQTITLAGLSVYNQPEVWYDTGERRRMKWN